MLFPSEILINSLWKKWFFRKVAANFKAQTLSIIGTFSSINIYVCGSSTSNRLSPSLSTLFIKLFANKRLYYNLLKLNHTDTLFSFIAYS